MQYHTNLYYLILLYPLIKNLSAKIKKHSVVEDFAKEIIDNITKNNSFIVETIEKTANNWSMSRMANIDRCILKIAVCEFFFFPLIPVKATINEAIEFKEDCTEEKDYEGEFSDIVDGERGVFYIEFTNSVDYKKRIKRNLEWG